MGHGPEWPTGAPSAPPSSAGIDSAAINAHARTTLLDMGDTPRFGLSGEGWSQGRRSRHGLASTRGPAAVRVGDAKSLPATFVMIPLLLTWLPDGRAVGPESLR